MQVASAPTSPTAPKVTTPLGAATTPPASSNVKASPVPKPVKAKKTFMQKKMPTMLGLGILVVSLIAGLLFFGNGTGVFAPRATPQTTPKNVKLTNVTDKSFTVSFYTDEATPSFVKYGTTEDSLKLQVSDDRAQLSGAVSKNTLHHITVKGLDAGKKYHYVLGTGGRSTFDNQGKPFVVTTSKKPTTPPPASKTIYGSVSTEGGTPADGSVVYVSIDGVGDMSALVRQSGSWAISLSNARSSDGTSYAEITDETPINLVVQGSPISQTTAISTTVKDAQPVTGLSLGKDSVAVASQDVKKASNKVASTSSSIQPPTKRDTSESKPSETSKIIDNDQKDSKVDASESTKIVDSANKDSTKVSTISAILDLEEVEATTEAKVTVENPKIVGKAPANVIIKISVHSDTQIEETVTADANGNFELDIATLSEDLEPGEHTVTYSYIDPDTGEEVIKTHTFMVEDTSDMELAMADINDIDSSVSDELADISSSADDSYTAAQTMSDSSSSATMDEVPYGSGNPYPIEESTESAIATESTDTSTRSAIVSTESGVLTAGSVGNTLALIIGGSFFIFTGLWSWWLAGQIEEVRRE